MLKRFVQEIETQNLFSSDDIVLLAVSGGMDSVSLCELFNMAKFSFAIAHCNFHLRGNDSDADELFVKNLAKSYGVPFHCASFDTKNYADENKLSIEEAARNLRYDFFSQIMENYGYSYVATAHHRDDAIETFFLNLMRGTGIVGLHGILQKNGRIIRPLLAFGRNEIENFISLNGLSYCTDVTNATLDYKRNKVRHLLMPVLRDIAPAFDKTMQTNIQHIADVELIYKTKVEELRTKLLLPHNDGFKLCMRDLELLNPLKTYLYEFLYPFGFSESVVVDILKIWNGSPGKQFFSNDYYIIKDREYLFIHPLQKDVYPDCVSVADGTAEIENPINLTIDELSRTSDFKFSPSRNIAYLDKDKLSFPLTLRKWESGDKFQPFGMKGKRKVSDFFTDAKLTLHDKKAVWLLCNGEGEILWLVGMRSDDRFKVTEQTKTILKITWNI